MPSLPRPLYLLPALLALAAGLATGPAPAQMILYRCTDAAGQLTVQNQPCPPGSQQREQVVGGVSNSPEPPGSTPATPATGRPADPVAAGGNDEGFRLWDSATLARERARAEADAATARRPPPPPLYRCSSREGDRYLSETAEPPAQCIALRTVGLDGNPATGAGQACEVVRDHCAAVSGTDACDAWRDRARQAQTRWRLAHPDNVGWRGDEYARIAAIVSVSCGD